MRGAHTVALVGFAHHEAATIESFLRLAARRPPAYRVQDEVIDAQLLIVNADNLQALHLVRHAGLAARVLLLGQHDGGTGWPLQRKPVKLVGMLSALDRLLGMATPVSNPRRGVGARQSAASGFFQTSGMRGFDSSLRRAGNRPSLNRLAGTAIPPVPGATSRRDSVDSAFPSTLPLRPPGAVDATARSMPPAPPAPAAMPDATAPASGSAARRPGVMRLTDFGSLEEMPWPRVASGASRSGRSSRHMRAHQHQAVSEPMPEPARADVLLVAQSLVEGRILHKRFKRYGLSIDWSREGPQALVMLKAHTYRLVVIDRLTGEPDAFQLCRSARQNRLPNGKAPVVLIFANTTGGMDRMKAGLAGCDAYLSRSVNEADLYKVLAQHRLVSLDGYEKTTLGF